MFGVFRQGLSKGNIKNIRRVRKILSWKFFINNATSNAIWQRVSHGFEVYLITKWRPTGFFPLKNKRITGKILWEAEKSVV